MNSAHGYTEGADIPEDEIKHLRYELLHITAERDELQNRVHELESEIELMKETLRDEKDYLRGIIKQLDQP